MTTQTLKQTALRTQTNIQQQIMTSLKLSEFTHNNHCFETGMSFLKQLFFNDEGHPDLTMLSCDKRFWNWFKSEWYIAQSKWITKSKTFTIPQIEVERKLYDEHMRYKCVFSKSVHDSFDQWLKLSIKELTA